ncbi:MAG TPA: hypothetical protein DD734_04925, partial [Firmicutes bacterium]|nr:hypothetical protein [Bacillota bacterium]
YIHTYSAREEKAPANQRQEQKDLKQIIIDGLKEEAAAAVKQLLKAEKGLAIVDHHLIPALDL